MNDTVNRKYVLVLGALAIAVLAVGTLLRPKKLTPEPPSPSETASLQARVRRDELGETASYFAQRAQALSRDVVYDLEHESSAVAWEKAGQVLTTAGPGTESFNPPLSLSVRDTGKPPVARPTDRNTGRWFLIVGRTADGQLLWTPAVYGGTRQTICGDEKYSELIVNARLDSALSGAGAFDLDGVLVGIVANCDGTYHLVSVASVPSLLQNFATSERKIEFSYGFHAAELNTDAKRLFSVHSGLFVTEVRQGDAADQLGLKAGDVITKVGGTDVSDRQGLTSALESLDESARALEVLRNRKRVVVRMPSLSEAERTRMAEAARGIHILPSTGVTESIYVAPGTPAYKAGLRTGDHLIQAGEKRSTSGTDLARTILALGDRPLLVVYQRNRMQKAALVSK